MRRLTLLAALALLGFVLPAGASAADSEITAAKSRYGKVLFDGDGRVLYLFTKEKTKKPRCYGGCSDAWPPMVVDDKPDKGEGARRKLIGTTKRKNGKRQATYRKHPLYYYEHDDPGEILCHDVFEYGGDWLVVTPRGKPAD